MPNDQEQTYEDWHESRYEHQPDVDEPGLDVYDGDDYDSDDVDEAQEWHDYDPDC